MVACEVNGQVRQVKHHLGESSNSPDFIIMSDNPESYTRRILQLSWDGDRQGSELELTLDADGELADVELADSELADMLTCCECRKDIKPYVRILRI